MPSRDAVASGWPASTPDQRFLLFVAWVVADNIAQDGARLNATDILQTPLLSADDLLALNYGGTPDDPALQLAVWTGVFASDTPDLALGVGDSVLILSQIFTSLDEAESDDAYEEQMGEWLDEMKKQLFDDMAEAFEALWEWFKEHTEEEEGASA